MSEALTAQDFQNGADDAIRDLLKIFNGIIECRQCKGRKKLPQPCRDLRGHYNLHFFHVQKFLEAVRDNAAKVVS